MVGIDEVGRGALGGAVTVAAFVFLRDSRFPSHIEGPASTRRRGEAGVPLRDSKRLTPRAREAWFGALRAMARAGNAAFATARVTPALVDRVNIRNAANLAATRAYERVVKEAQLSPSSVTVLLDGGLSIRPRASMAPRRAYSVVRGDELVPEIQCASIAAKVTRDRAMVRLHARHPAYGFAAHKGYGTEAHRIALVRFGPLEGFHRLTFLRKFLRVSAV